MIMRKASAAYPDAKKIPGPSEEAKQIGRRNRLRSPLARKQLFLILLFSSIITLMGASFQIYTEYRNDMNAIDLQLDQVENGYLPSLTSSLWKLDDQQLHIQLTNMLSMRDVIRLEIYEQDQLTYSAGKSAQNNRQVRRSYEMVHTRNGVAEQIGSLHAIASLEGVHQRLGRRVIIVLTTQGIKTFLVSFFILAIIHFLVTRHLHTMAGHVRRLDPSNSGTPLTLPKRLGAADELDDVAGAINAMEQRIAEDIQDREQATKVLAESEERLRRNQSLLKTVLSSLDEVVLMVEPHGQLIVDANATVNRIFGYQLNEIIGRGTDFLHVDTRQYRRFDDNCRAACAEHGFFAGEYQMRRKDGMIFDTEHYVTKIPSQQGTPELEISIIRDISRRKILEAHVQQTQKLEAVGTLTGGIAHDFNNILGIVMGNTELALDQIDQGQPGRSNLEEIMAASARAKEVISQLLSYGRKTDQLLVPLNLTKVVESTVKLLRSSIPANIDLQQYFESGLSAVRADPGQIHQVVLNLCTNSKQAMTPGGGCLTIRLANTTLTHQGPDRRINLPAGPYVQLTVSDTGQGIPAEYLDKVFDPYFTTKETGKGTGLGMSVVHGIVKNHHGAVSLNSRVGEGTEVSVYLPAVDLPARVDPDEKHLATAALPKGKANVLIVDDEPQLVQLGKRMLQKLGYSVETTTRPEEAIALVNSAPSRLDLLITDYSMPGMSGLELARRIHARRPQLPIILCSGISTRIDRDAARASGVTRLLAKPYNLEKLAEALASALEQRLNNKTF